MSDLLARFYDPSPTLALAGFAAPTLHMPVNGRVRELQWLVDGQAWAKRHRGADTSLAALQAFVNETHAVARGAFSAPGATLTMHLAFDVGAHLPLRARRAAAPVGAALLHAAGSTRYAMLEEADLRRLSVVDAQASPVVAWQWSRALTRCLRRPARDCALTLTRAVHGQLFEGANVYANLCASVEKSLANETAVRNGGSAPIGKHFLEMVAAVAGADEPAHRETARHLIVTHLVAQQVLGSNTLCSARVLPETVGAIIDSATADRGDTCTPRDVLLADSHPGNTSAAPTAAKLQLFQLFLKSLVAVDAPLNVCVFDSTSGGLLLHALVACVAQVRDTPNAVVHERRAYIRIGAAFLDVGAYYNALYAHFSTARSTPAVVPAHAVRGAILAWCVAHKLGLLGHFVASPLASPPLPPQLTIALVTGLRWHDIFDDKLRLDSERAAEWQLAAWTRCALGSPAAESRRLPLLSVAQTLATEAWPVASVCAYLRGCGARCKDTLRALWTSSVTPPRKKLGALVLEQLEAKRIRPAAADELRALLCRDPGAPPPPPFFFDLRIGDQTRLCVYVSV